MFNYTSKYAFLTCKFLQMVSLPKIIRPNCVRKGEAENRCLFLSFLCGSSALIQYLLHLLYPLTLYWNPKSTHLSSMFTMKWSICLLLCKSFDRNIICKMSLTVFNTHFPHYHYKNKLGSMLEQLVPIVPHLYMWITFIFPFIPWGRAELYCPSQVT